MVTSVNSKMTAIADAIRNLLDISGTMGLDAMASNISSITKRGAVAGTISTKSEQYIIPAGYHNGNGTVGIDIAEQAKIIAENIKNGVTILGVSGTASGDAYAVIAVTYPAGSVCTCSDGIKTLELKDTGGQGFFLIPYAGTWTVTCTDGTETALERVEITAEGQSATISLSYRLVLVKNGVVKDNPLSLYSTTSFATFQTAENVFRVAANNTGHLTAYFDNLIPITDYSKVAITIAGGRTAYNLFFGLVRDKKIGIDISGSDYLNNTKFDIASVSFGKGILPAQTKEIDLSSITSGNCYLGFAFGTTGGFNDSVYGNGGFDLADVVLTK